MSNHPVFSDDMREIVESFVVETQEIFDDLNDDLLRLERAEDTFPIIDKVFRAVHTVKGTSGFLSLDQLNLLAHSFEDVLNRLRRREIPFHPGMMDVLFAAFDLMNVLLQQVLDSAVEPVPMDGLLDDLQQLASDGFPEGYDVGNGTDRRSTGLARQASIVPGSSFPEDDSVEEEVNLHSEERLQRTSVVEDTTLRNRHADTVRVGVERLDDLLSLVGELVLHRNRLNRILTESAEDRDEREFRAELAAASSQIDSTTSRLQSAVLQTRMVPVGRVFSRFQLVVRELSRELHKDVELVVEGGDTELDKAIVDELSDPILHLMRNAVDHGIEAPAERKRRDKPACGRLLLRAEHDGGHILITMADDGAGIDVDALRRRAVRRGFAEEGEAASMSDADLLDLIFKAGFSTNEQTTRISGRGMGMDVVKSAIGRLGGEVRVRTDHGQGTRFMLRLPLTLAIMKCLLVESGDETYAIPLNRISEVVAVRKVSTVRGRRVIRFHDEILPLVDVAETFGFPVPVRREIYAVVVRKDRERFGLVVDHLRGQEEVIIKPLNAYLRSVEGFSGSTIFGDGRVVMVLNVDEVIHMERAQQCAEPPQRAAASA